MLTIQILTLDNRGTIERCVESLSGLGRVVVGDMGSEDGTPDICSDMGCEVRGVKFGGCFSELRNSMASDGLNMYIEPWEFVASGADRIGSLAGNAAFYVVQGGVVSKQVRLWGSGSFRNPVFEHIDGGDEPSVHPEIVVYSSGGPDRREQTTEACRAWSERSPTAPDPYYYLACSLLSEGRLDEFLGCARKYMIMDANGGDSSVLMNYYMARIEASKGMFRDSSRRVLSCVAARPTFAEFWCLLGDMLYSRGKYEKARAMYENARVIGKRRRSDDLFPIEVSKYGEYPEAMERRCLEATSKGFTVAKKAHERHI